MLVSVSQAAYLVRRDQRAVRYRIARGHLRAEAGEDGYTRLDTEALGRVRGWTVDLDRLAEVMAEDGRTARSLAARLAAVERRIAQLERVISGDASMSAQDERQTAWRPATAMVTLARPDSSLSASGDVLARAGHLPPLPDSLVSVASFAEAHGIPPQTWRKAMDVGRLPTVEGEWRVVRSLTRHALDAEGRRVFFALWGHRADFRKCPDCPHS